MNVRRVVIATDSSGRSVVCERCRESPRPRLRQHTGLRKALVGATAPGPTLPSDGADPTPGAPSLVPDPGATSFIVLTFPPDAVYADRGFDGRPPPRRPPSTHPASPRRSSPTVRV